MKSLQARWVPVFRFEPIDDVGHEALQALESDSRYTCFFRYGLGETAKELECRVDLAASLESIPLETRHNPELPPGQELREVIMPEWPGSECMINSCHG